MPPWNATFLTLYPDAFPGTLGVGVLARGRAAGLWNYDLFNPRDFTSDKHRTVDDTPAGGGPGMVMRADVLARTLDAVPADGRPRLLLSARGRKLTQLRVRALAEGPGAVLVCGRFEGVDQRVVEARDLEEVSIADIVLAGGEVAAQALVEACVRLRPGVLGAPSSRAEESFEQGLLEYPHFTRPREFEGRLIPSVLLSGDHRKIADWRQAEAEKTTRARRPDLLQDGEGPVQSAENQNEDGSPS